MTIFSELRRAFSTPLERVLLTSLLLPLVLSSQDWRRAVAGTLFVIPGLLFPQARRASWFWFGLAGISGIAFLVDYSRADDHIALATYWYLALGLSLRSPNALILIRHNARLLIGATFALAFLWKLRSPDFISTGFFEFKLLTDPRFGPWATWFGGLERADLDFNANQLALAPLTRSLQSSDGVAAFSGMLTYGTLLLEPFVAVTWLAKSDRHPELRHLALWLFVVLTYALVPVAGFGILLLAMGSSDNPVAAWGRIYYWILAILFLWSIVWLWLW